MELAGIVGKANVGKSTLFTALTMVDVPAANFPFTTVRPNRGITYLRYECVCKELGVKDEPVNSYCIDGVRLIPIQIIDCPGIVKGAHAGRGLGLQFLDEIRQADALIIVADASGGTDIDGNPIEQGTHDPVEDVLIVEEEMDRWMYGILQREWPRIARASEAKQVALHEEIARRFSGLGIDREAVLTAERLAGLDGSRPASWKELDVLLFIRHLRRVSKPFIVAANKADTTTAKKGIDRLKSAGYDVVPCSAEAEKTLRKAAEKGYIKYRPGDRSFEIIDQSKLTPAQKAALDRIAAFMEKYGGTGVQNLIDKTYLELLNYIPIYPVEDPYSLTDGKGRILPDVYLVKKGSTPRDLAYKIHSDLGETFLYAIDARTKLRLSTDYQLKQKDIISIVSAKKKG